MNATVRRLALLIPLVLNGSALAQADGPPTLWKFLGIPQAYQRVNGAVVNRRGNFPGLERKPPVLPLADPLNLESDIAPLKAAAEIKMAEDLKKQKIKAVKYLASIGCGCYDKDGKVSDALAAALDDCTEDVRMATIEALQAAAQEAPCNRCGISCCCKEKVVMQLARLAYERDEKGCCVEPSERVRQAAAQALEVCCPGRGPVQEIAPPPPQEGTPEVPQTPEVPEIPGTPEQLDATTQVPGTLQMTLKAVSAKLTGRGAGNQPAPAMADNRRQPVPAGGSRLAATAPQSIEGAIVWVDLQAGQAHVHLAGEGMHVSAGSRLHAYRRMLNGELRPVAELTVVKPTPGGANVHTTPLNQLSLLRRGDLVMASQVQQGKGTNRVVSTEISAAQVVLAEWMAR